MSDFFEHPKDIAKAYEDGLVGASCDPEDLSKLLGELPMPLFGAAAYALEYSGEGKLSLPFKSVLKVDPTFGGHEAQTTGDCFEKGTKVLMEDGSVKDIETIGVGEKVRTHQNRSRRVESLVKKMPSNGTLTDVCSEKYDIRLSMTDDHKVMVFTDYGYDWVQTKDLKLGDLLVLPTRDGKLSQPQVVESASNITTKATSIATTLKSPVACDKGVLSPISSITSRVYDEPVYCINVEEDHSFIANSCVVHNCVSHGTRNAVDITRMVEIDIEGQPESFIARGATEGIYQSRGHRGRGMSCSQAARYVNSQGGILLRQKYDGVDLSVYNSKTGSNSRIPRAIFIDEAQKHQVKTTSLLTTLTEARDALANGYALACCSGIGFTSVRDKNGISRRKGSWSHCMAWIACDDTRELYDEMLFLIQNSWGSNWNGGPKRHGQPDGSFWVRERDAQAIMNARGSFAFSNVEGFPARQLPDYGLGEWV